MAGVVGRDSGEVRLEVLASSGGAELDEVIDSTTLAGAAVCTDEWRGYARTGGRHERVHRAVDHSAPISAAGMEINLSDSRRAVMAWDRAPRPSGQVDLF